MDFRNIDENNFNDVIAIYKEGIDTGIATFETELPDWKKWDSSHLNYGRIIIYDGSSALGWAALSPVSSRCVYGGVAEVSVYVSSRSRGQGIGSLLLKELIQISEQHNLWTLQSSIFRKNEASKYLHLKCGFREIGYKEKIGQLKGVWYDNILLERRSKKVGSTSKQRIKHTMDTRSRLEDLSKEFDKIPQERKLQLQALANLVKDNISQKGESYLNFICTHNSRRSQLAQVCLMLAADHYGIKNVFALSGGTEATAFNHRMVDALVRFGLELKQIEAGDNPVYSLDIDENTRLFSKTYDHPSSSEKDFIAVMVCDHADENCPFVPGASSRFSLQYEDPKAFDDSPKEKEAYDNKIIEIAREILFLTSNIS